MPSPSAFPQRHRARVVVAGGTLHVVQIRHQAFEARRFRHRRPHIIAGPLPQDADVTAAIDHRHVPSVAGDEQVRRRRHQRPQRAGGERCDTPPAPARPPQAEPDPAGDHQRIGAVGHGRQHRHGAGHRGGLAGDHQQQVKPLPRHPPGGRAEPDQVEEQGQRLGGHDDEGGERDGDDVRRRAVKTRLVEIIEADRRKGQLDRQACEDEAGNRPPYLQRQRLVPRSEEFAYLRVVVKGDKSRDGGEAQLEARAHQGVGPQDEDDQRPSRDDP